MLATFLLIAILKKTRPVAIKLNQPRNGCHFLSNLKLAVKACALILNLTQIYILLAKKIIYLKFNTTHKIKFELYF
ncbi:hypothetical protein CCS77_1471 [Campylobacter concisus]|uniref:Uncharacterized protein n=1 Tax=Campylobacter concisus TaxID=199 RepID=A0A2R4P1F8_9BACT|nr:hypothetical protein CCS77_1471 [Campylobacter concisus]